MLYTDLEDVLVKVRASLEHDDVAGAVAALEALRAPDQADLFSEPVSYTHLTLPTNREV